MAKVQNNAVFVLDSHHQTVTIALDVEHHPVVSDKAGVAVNILDIYRGFPGGPFDVCIPGLQRLPCIWVSFPKISYPNSANDRRISFNSPSVMPHNSAAASFTWASITLTAIAKLHRKSGKLGRQQEWTKMNN